MMRAAVTSGTKRRRLHAPPVAHPVEDAEAIAGGAKRNAADDVVRRVAAAFLDKGPEGG